MFRKLLCASMLFSALAMVACSNSSSSNGGGGATQQDCTPTQGNQAVEADPQQPGMPPLPGHDSAFPPGLPGNNPNPQQPPQQPPQQQPGAPAAQPCLQGSNAVQGTWAGETQTLQNGAQIQLQLEVVNTEMNVTLTCSANNDRVQTSTTVQINVTGNVIRVVQGGQNQTPFGQGQCALEIKTGTAFNFAATRTTLTLTKDGEASKFTRVGPPPVEENPIQQPAPGQPNQPGQGAQGVFGRWSTGELSQDANLSAHMILYISQGQMTAMAACIDKRSQQQVQAMVTVPVTIDSHTINIQRDAADSKPLGGQECSINIPAGPFDYTLNGNRMTVTTRNSQLEFTRF